MPDQPNKINTTAPQVQKATSPIFWTVAEKFRSSGTWKNYSSTLRKIFPLCQGLHCKEFNTGLHHIVPLAHDIQLAITMTNTIPLCTSCHRLYEYHRTPEEVINAWGATCAAYDKSHLE